MDRQVRLAVVGGNRGTAFNSTLDFLKGKVTLQAICDIDESKVAEWKKKFPGITGYTSYEQLLDDPAVDAVFLATPIKYHFAQTKAALLAGKHVLCEVYAAKTIAELEELVRLVEDTGLIYMLAENYVYMRQNMLVLNMAKQGVFGDITYAEGGYIHDCRPIRITDKGEVTWRGEEMRIERGNNYPTHSLGPIAKWLGITETDEMIRSATFISGQASMNRIIYERFGAEHPALRPGYWAYGDSTITTIECKSGALILLRFDGDSLRPHNMVNYQLQGTKAAYLSGRFDEEDGLLWVDGVSGKNKDGTAQGWDNMYKHAYAYEHEEWRRNMANARQLGHGGGDFFILQEFVDAIREQRRPFIDIYDAAAWSSIVPISQESAAKGSIPIDIPRFPRK